MILGLADGCGFDSTGRRLYNLKSMDKVRNRLVEDHVVDENNN
jgi:hypothetical protein